MTDLVPDSRLWPGAARLSDDSASDEDHSAAAPAAAAAALANGHQTGNRPQRGLGPIVEERPSQIRGMSQRDSPLPQEQSASVSKEREPASLLQTYAQVNHALAWQNSHILLMPGAL